MSRNGFLIFWFYLIIPKKVVWWFLAQQESPFFITADDVNEVIRAFFMLKAQAAKAKDALQGEKAMK